MSRGSAVLGGRDLARMRRRERTRHPVLPAALIGGLLAALFLAALRVDLIRIGYGMAAAVREEKALLEVRRGHTAALRKLRDPVRLMRLATAQGLKPPERSVELPSPPGAPDRQP
jgi:hypothetical protein